MGVASLTGLPPTPINYGSTTTNNPMLQSVGKGGSRMASIRIYMEEDYGPHPEEVDLNSYDQKLDGPAVEVPDAVLEAWKKHRLECSKWDALWESYQQRIEQVREFEIASDATRIACNLGYSLHRVNEPFRDLSAEEHS